MVEARGSEHSLWRNMYQHNQLQCLISLVSSAFCCTHAASWWMKINKNYNYHYNNNYIIGKHAWLCAFIFGTKNVLASLQTIQFHKTTQVVYYSTKIVIPVSPCLEIKGPQSCLKKNLGSPWRKLSKPVASSIPPQFHKGKSNLHKSTVLGSLHL